MFTKFINKNCAEHGSTTSIHKSRDLMWERIRFCQVTHFLKLFYLSFHLIKVCIYVKLLVH